MNKIKKIALISPSVMLSKRPFNQDLWLDYLRQSGLEVVVLPSALNELSLILFRLKKKLKIL